MYRLSEKMSSFLTWILGDNTDNITYLDQSDPEALEKTIRFLHDNESTLERMNSIDDMMDFCFSHEQWTKFRDNKLNDITPKNILEEHVISPTVIDAREPFRDPYDKHHEISMEHKSSKEEDLINERLNQKYERFKKENDMNEEYMNGNIGKEFPQLDCRNPYMTHKSFEELSGNRQKDNMKEACDLLKQRLDRSLSMNHEPYDDFVEVELTDLDSHVENTGTELKAGSGYQRGGINTIDLTEKENRDMKEISERISKLAEKHGCDHVVFTKDPSAFDTDNYEMAELKDKIDGKHEKYEMVNHPSHYNSSSIETIEKMIRIWGPEQTATWCEMTAFKYRERIGNKPDNSLEQEMGKIRWYELKAKELRS